MIDFKIENRAGIPVIVWPNGSCRPANAVEKEQDAEIARLKAEYEGEKITSKNYFTALEAAIYEREQFRQEYARTLKRSEALEKVVREAIKIAKMRSKYPANTTNYYFEHIEEIERILSGAKEKDSA